MTDKLPNTVNVIKKLTDMLPTLSETEAEAARYQIEQLKNENPFLSGKETNPQSILESWEARDTSRAKIIARRIKQEKDLIEGYSILMQENSTAELLERVEKARRIIYFLEREMALIKRLLSDAFSTKKNCNPALIFNTEKKEDCEKVKRSGRTHLSIVELLSKNPLYKDIVISIYADEIFIGQVAQNEIDESKPISIEFKNTYRLEFIIMTKDNVMVGDIFFPIQDLVDAEDIGVRNFYYNISDNSTLSISFGKCVLDSDGISRASNTIITKRSAEHLLRRIESTSLYRCGVCGNSDNNEDTEEYYRCDMCKFTCHMRCTHLIFFECNEFKKKKEIESEKAELEAQLEKMKQERLSIIIAAIDIREKPKETDTVASRVSKPKRKGANHDSSGGESNSSDLSSDAEKKNPVPTKRYSVEHSLAKDKMLGAVWCCHCGERIGMLAIALECTVCQNTYHTACRSMLFKSCGITLELLTGLIAYMPKLRKKKSSKISIEEFKFISLLHKEGDGKVYLCAWGHKTVCLKAVKKKTIIDHNYQNMMDTERTCLEIAKTSNNPFLLQLLGCFQTKTHIFFITEFVQGGDLYYHLQTRDISDKEVQMILAGLVIAIEWLHSENIIYRNLALENVMFAENGYIKLINMELCSIGAAKGIAHTLCGSIPAIAPEMIDEHYTKKVDWWSLGVLAYQLVLKTPPFTGSSVKQIKEAIQNDPPANIDQIEEPMRSFIAGLLEKNVEKRLGTESVEDIKNHVYFKDFDWEKMKKQKLPVCWTPQAGSNVYSNFDQKDIEKDPELSPAEEIDSTLDVYFQDF
ncbi:hypothetical protein NEAUS04_0760 [Nematocida ausubeli]|nr:hypothetical protein NEAUS04_0103 [Nematocida ausubeli]KAI5161875.1 hypothetical protein NEAUS04_0760 [Nematocida ausubeli]